MKDNMTYKKTVRIKDVDVEFRLSKSLPSNEADAMVMRAIGDISHGLTGKDRWVLAALPPLERLPDGSHFLLFNTMSVFNVTITSLKLALGELVRAVELRLEYPLQQDFIDDGFEVV